MSSVDVAIRVTEKTFSQIIAALHSLSTLHGLLFTGRKTIQVEGLSLTIDYDVFQSPTAVFAAPTPEQWQKALKQDGSTLRPLENAFILHFPKVRVNRSAADGRVVEMEIAFDAICTARLSGMTVYVAPLAVTVDLSSASAMDQIIYRRVIIPEVLKQTDTLLSGLKLPELSFQGVQFGPSFLQVAGGRMIIAVNLAHNPAPAAAPSMTWPDASFAVMVSPEAMQQMANVGTVALVGRESSTSGRLSTAIGDAGYSADVHLKQVSVSVDAADLTTVGAAVRFAVSASAGVTFLGIPIGIHYDATTSPTDVGTKIHLSFADAVLKGTVREVDLFAILFTPSGTLAETVLSAVAWPVAQTLGIVVPPLARSLFDGYTFDLLLVTAARIVIGTDSLNVGLSSPSLNPVDGYLAIQGDFVVF